MSDVRFVERLKGLGGDALLYGIGGVLGRFAALISTPILTRVLTPAEFGLIALLHAVVGFLALVAGANIVSGVMFHYYDQDDPEARQSVLSVGLVWHLIAGLAFAGAAFAFAPQLADLLRVRVEATTLAHDEVRLLRILSLGLLFQLLDGHFLSVLRLQRRPIPFSVLSLIQAVGNLTLVVVLVLGLGWGVEGALWSSVGASGLSALLGFLLLARQHAWRAGFLGRVLRFALPALPSVLLGFGLMHGNRFFLNYFSPLAEQGRYEVALKASLAFVVVTSAFRVAWDPFAVSIMKQPDAKQTYARVYTLYVAGMVVAAGVLSSFAKPFVTFLAPPEYHSAILIVPVFAWAFLAREGNNVLAIGIGISKRTEFVSYAQIPALLTNVGCALWLVPRYGALGAAAAFALGSLAQTCAYYVFAQRLYPIPYRFARQQGFALVMFGAAVAVVVALAQASLLVSLGAGAASAIGFLGASWFLGLGAEERGLVRELVSGLGRRTPAP